MAEEAVTYAVLGPVRALYGHGDALDLGGVQRRALLAQLVLARPHVVSADALAHGLWGDRPPATSAKSIQVHVSRLRQVLPGEQILTASPGYRLDIGERATDLGRFEADAAAGRAHLAAGRYVEAADLFHRALSWWSGPVLADVADHPFAAGPVARLNEARLAALDDRLTTDLALGRHTAVVSELEGLVQAHPFRETLWAALMTALARSGRQADALAAFARARRALVDEHGIEPGAGLREVERQVLDGTLEVGPVDSVGPSPKRWLRPKRNAHGPVVGRQGQLGQLGAALGHAIASSRARAVAVLGDEGMGKTSLIAAFSDALEPAVSLVAGRCREELQAPYAPWADVLRELGADSELHLVEGDDPGSESPERRKARLYGGVIEQLRTQAALGPLVVTLDDLHWADVASVSLLIHALDELAEDPVLFLLAWRGREIGSNHPVTRLEHRLSRNRAGRIELSSLEASQIAELVSLAHPRAEAAHIDDVAERLHQVTGGMPLFVTEAIATIGGRHRELPELSAVAVELPRTMRTLIGRRLAEAGDQACTVAEACAVLGEPFDSTVVGAMVDDLDAPAVLLALDHLVTAGVLHEGDQGHTFSHAAFREVVLSMLLSGRRRTLHAMAYEALAEVAPPAVRVRHAEGAGDLLGSEILHRDLMAAGANAVRRGAFLDAAALFERVLEATGPEESPDALVALADARWRAGDIGGAKKMAAAVVERAGDPGLGEQTLTDAAVLHGTFGSAHGVDQRSIDLAQRALEMVTDPDLRVRLEAAIAYQLSIWGAPRTEAGAAVQRAKALRTPTTAMAAQVEILFAEGLSLLGDPDLDRRFEVAAELEEIGRQAGAWRDVGRALRLRCLCEMSAGRLDALDRSIVELSDVADRTGSWMYRSDAVRWRIAVALVRGEHERAGGDLDELMRIASSQLVGRAFVDTQRFLVAWAAGDIEACVDYLDHLRSLLPPDPRASSDGRLVDLCRMRAQIDRGQASEVRAEFVATAPQHDLDRAPSRCYVSELVLTADLMTELDIPEGADDVLDRLAPFTGQVGVLSWGECLLGSIERYEIALRSLVHRACDDAGFERVLAHEQSCGFVAAEARTAAAWERARSMDLSHR